MIEKECVDKQVMAILNEKKLFDNPLIKSFLENNEHYDLIKKAIVFPNKDNKTKVDELFKIHYEKIRLKAYFNNLIRFYAIDFDKKVRKTNHRFDLVLDKPIGTDTTQIVTQKEILKESPNYLVEDKSLHEAISNEFLHRSLEVLTETQYNIIELIYVNKLTNNEIAKLTNSTPQNISNIHRKSIKKLRKKMKG